MKPFDWTAERRDLLRARLESGARPRAVADELGTTRNSVLGTAHRMGLSWTRTTVLDRGGVKSRIRPAARVEVALLDDVLATRPEKGVPLWELRRTSCRWLLEPGAPWAFCGAPAVAKKAYCAEHAPRVYVPLRREER